MHHVGCKSCHADPDVWTRSAVKSDGTEVYGYVFYTLMMPFLLELKLSESWGSRLATILSSTKNQLDLLKCIFEVI
jgi:hypothetical protein